MTTTNTVKRVTKAQRFSDIKALLNGEAVAYDTTLEIATEFIDKELELLAKKNTSDKKPTATQVANEGYKAQILEFLMTCENGATCTEVMKGIPDFADFNNQKVASLMRQLKDEQKVTRNTVKGKSIFSIC